MSFTSNIKNEIVNNDYSMSELIAELSAILNIGVNINDTNFHIYIENVSVSRRVYKLLKDIYHINIEMNTTEKNNLRNKKIVIIIVSERYRDILEDLSIIEENKRISVPKEYIIGSTEDKIAYLRGAFEICGSINDPKTSRYHLEFVIKNKDTASLINTLLNELSLNSKLLKRDKCYMVYIKESEKISDFLKILSAQNSLFYYEDIRIYRDLKNMTNRTNNCDQANAEKTIKSANEQLELIKELKSIIDYDLLDEKLQEIIIYREKYQDVSMSELAEIISYETNNPITKSGINHRFRKIREVINKLKE